MAAQARNLTLDELQKAEVFVVVWDKYGNKFFKLNDGSWSSDSLDVYTSEDLMKRKVKLYELS